MAKHTLTATGMKVTKTGRMMYHTPYQPHDPNHIMSKRGSDVSPGDNVWEWAYGSRIGKKKVGIVTKVLPSVSAPTQIGTTYMTTEMFEIQSVNGTVETIYPENTVKLTDDEYDEIVDHFKAGGK